MIWNKRHLPHKDWWELGNTDLREEGVFDRDQYATCEMCGRKGIRFVHKMAHPDFSGILSVGGTCASKMSRKKVEVEGQSAGTEWPRQAITPSYE